MSRRPTRQLTWAFVLRTFKRVDMIAVRYSSEAIAKALVERGVKIPSPQYMDDVWQYMRKFTQEAGGDTYAHPNGNCPQCGHDIGRDHTGARYCSNRCRQRAYRMRRDPEKAFDKALRLNKRGRPPKRHKTPKERHFNLAESETNVTQASS